MTRRRWWQRAFAALLGCWVTLASVEPVPLHPCAMHEGAAGAAVQAAVVAALASPAGDAAAHAAAHAPAHHGAHGSAADEASPAATHEMAATAAVPASHDGHDDGACLCIGCCTGAPTMAAAPAAPLAWLAALRLDAPQLDPHGASFAPASRDDVALPFPVGPPAPVA